MWVRSVSWLRCEFGVSQGANETLGGCFFSRLARIFERNQI
jgi:hypothetical protein